jgi:hypothetical protein
MFRNPLRLDVAPNWRQLLARLEHRARAHRARRDANLRAERELVPVERPEGLLGADDEDDVVDVDAEHEARAEVLGHEGGGGAPGCSNHQGNHRMRE